jgi:hypothetical protein
MSPAQRDKLEARIESRGAGLTVKALETDGRQSWESDDAAFKLRLNTAIENGQWDNALDAAADMRNANHLNEGEYHTALDKIGKARREGYYQADIKQDPGFVVSELDKVKRGEQSKSYPMLKDPVDIDRLYRQAQGELDRRQVMGRDSIQTDILDGTPLTVQEVKERAAAMHLDPKETASLEKMASESIPYNDKASADAMRLVEEYDARGDKNLKEYNRISRFIEGTTSKEIQALLLPELKEKWNSRDTPRSPQEDELSQVSKQIDDYWKNNLLVSETGKKLPSGMGEERGEKTEIKDKEAYDLAQKRRMDLRWAAREYMRQNPDFKQGALREYINGLMSPDAKAAARAAAKGAPQERRAEFEAIRKLPGVPGAGMPPELMPPEPLSEEALIKREQEAAKAQQPQAYTPPSAPPQSSRAVPRFNEAIAGPGEAHEMSATAYVPGMGGIEGGRGVAERGGPAYRMEDYAEGTAPWVSVAMDSESPLQGKFLVNSRHPNVVFKVEDTGSAFQGKGESRIDIAFRDRGKATNFREAGTWKVVDENTANMIASQARGEGRIGAVSKLLGKTEGVNPDLLRRVASLQPKFGKLEVISGYRSPEHNRAVGGARGSEHTHGNAVDINTRDMSREEKVALIEAASRAGITGIGVYANNLHFDMARRRAWGPDYSRGSVPKWAEEVIRRHLA